MIDATVIRWPWLRLARRGSNAAGHLGEAVGVLVAMSVLVFLMIPLFPGDPARVVLAAQATEMPTEAAVELKRHELGLDRPLAVQYGDWVTGLVRGDLGRSWISNTPVLRLLGERVPATLLLSGLGLIIALTLTLVVGLVAAARPGGAIDRISQGAMVLTGALPAFVLGLLALQFVVRGLGIGSVVPDGTVRTAWTPACVLGLSMAAAWVRPFRALAVDALGAVHVEIARSRGASTAWVLVVHVLPNALVGFLPFVALGVGALMGGSLFVEAVFTWPGLGPFLFEAIADHDVPVIQGYALMATLAYFLSAEVSDGLARLLDPRLRPSRGTARDG
ncbi:MAG: ABC transporter permease [Egibacteraceae bacterium]